MIEEIDDRLEDHIDYAINDLRYLGFEVGEEPPVRFGTDIPNDRIAYYEPRDDVIYVAQDPENLSESEYSELMTELQKQVIRSNAVDEVEIENLNERYREVIELRNEARKPLDRIFEALEDEIASTYDRKSESALLSPALAKYRDKLEMGNYDALDRLVDPERTSILDDELESLEATEGTREEINFYKKLLETQYDFLAVAVDRKSNLEMLIRHQMENSKLANKKVEQAASLLIGPLNHGEIEQIKGTDIERFMDNINNEDEEIKQITEEIMSNMRIADESSPEAKFRDALDNAREFWS